MGNEIFGHSSMGPVFGNKHDFFTFDGTGDILSEKSHGGTNTPAFGSSMPHGGTNTPLFGFGMPHGGTNPPAFGSNMSHGGTNSFALGGQPLICAAHIPKTQDRWRLEVLRVGSVDPAAGDLEAAWQKSVSWSPEDGKRLQDKVLSFDPRAKRLPVDNINILLCGGVGAGKSSFVSTIDSLCEGRISRLAPHGTGTGSLTRSLRKYTFTDPETDQLVHWKLWDSMGWGVNDYKQGELNYILDGNLPDGCDLDRPISAQTPGFKAQPSLGDRVHCVILVVPCDSATDECYMKRLGEMRQFARARDLMPLVLLTKIDSYDPDVIGEDLTKTFHSARLLHLMEEVADISGVGGRKDVLPIKNFCDESEPTAEAGILVFRALQEALYAAIDHLRRSPEMINPNQKDAEIC
ncbi:hypothetical protein WJX79_002778 [Trebouxia sp. C0005]